MNALLLLLALLVCSPPAAASEAVRVGGVDHVGLTVTDLEASAAFFTDALGFETIRRDAAYPAVFLTNGKVIVTLWRATDPKNAVAFNRKHNVGLHHLAFAVDSFEKLDAVYERVKQVPGIRIEFSPEPLSGGPAKHMMMREPSGNRVEFIHRPAPDGQSQR
jgi:lactoylglutathione lyase